MCGRAGAQSRGPTPTRAAGGHGPTGLSQRSRRSCDLLSPVPKWRRAGGGQEGRQEASSLGQAAHCAAHRSRPGARAAHKLAHVDGSQTAPGEKAEERAQRTAGSRVRRASAEVGRQRALRKPLIDPGKRVRKACWPKLNPRRSSSPSSKWRHRSNSTKTVFSCTSRVPARSKGFCTGWRPYSILSRSLRRTRRDAPCIASQARLLLAPRPRALDTSTSAQGRAYWVSKCPCGGVVRVFASAEPCRPSEKISSRRSYYSTQNRHLVVVTHSFKQPYESFPS